jgi:outer membrane receptor protein involved in Fe transport
VLLDGIPLNDAWGEWIDWNRAPKGSIDHVEVMEGGGANLYGNGAIGGVINLFSRPISPGAYHFVVDGGDRGAHHFYGQAGMALGGGFAFGLSGDYGEGGGYQLIEPGQGAGPIDRASTSILRNLAGRLEYAPSADFSAFLSGHLFSDYRHLGTPLTSAARTDGATTAGFNYGNSNSGALNVRLWVRDMKETDVGSSLLTVNGVARADERLNNIAQIPSYDRGISLVWNRNNLLGFQSFSVGGDYRYMGGFYDEQDYNNNAANAPSTHFNSGGNQSLSGVFVSGVLAPAADWRIELSGRVDNWANNDGVASTPSGNATYPNSSKMSFSPRVGVRYQVTPDFSMHTAVYQAFRAPNLAELYRAQASATVITIPNPSLKPEYGTGYELGLDWQPAPWIQLKGTIYQADYNDFNTFVTTVNTPPAVNTRMRENVQKARSQGGEIYLALRPIDHFTFSGSFNYDDDRITDLGPNAPSTTTFVSARIGRVPIQKATGKAQYDSPLIGTWMVMGRYEGSNTTLGNSFTLPEFGVADASWNKPLMGGLSIFASIENIFDRKYQVNFSGSTSAPIVTLGLPRTVRAGFDLTKF